MIKYAKITNSETGLCEVGLGTNAEFYQSIGMVELDVQQSDIDSNWYLLDKCPMKTDEQKELEERERLSSLSLTKREIFLALYDDIGVTPDEIEASIENPKYLIEFKYANEYFRGNPLVDVIGNNLGYTTEQIDYLFLNKKFPKILGDFEHV